MTPSELAKVREAITQRGHTPQCAVFSRTKDGGCDCGAPAHNARVLEALAILDREAGRKTERLYTAEELRQHGARETADALKDVIETIEALRAFHERASRPAPDPQS